jgi:uncharacterized membrane protein
LSSALPIQPARQWLRHKLTSTSKLIKRQVMSGYAHRQITTPIKSQLYEVFNAIAEYPALHNWIQDTKIESDARNGRQEFFIKFKFPWPVGERWSRVEVQREGDSVISWHQLEGTLKMNQGRIVIAEHEQQAHIDYRAVIDVGFPNAVTRSYKKQFVSEFLSAIHYRTNNGGQSPDETSASAARLMLVTSNP